MSKVAAVVLTCSKPQYKERVEAQTETYTKLTEAKVDVFLLYHDPSTEFCYVKDRDNISKYLYLPVPEDYEYLPLRMWSALDFLRKQGYTHFLKMDDDIQILPHIDMLQLYHAIHILSQGDYIAIKGVGGREIHEKEGTIVVNSYHWTKCKNPFLNRTYCIYPAVEYAGGPCYWISANAIQKMKQSDFEKCFFEDVCLGIACKKNGIQLGSAVDLFRQIIRGDDSPWPYTQYILKNYSMWQDMIYN
jgi:hypothetical protein